MAADEAPASPRPIQPADDVYRRIHPDWIVDDQLRPGKKRLSSAVFRALPDSPCSGFLACECALSDVLGEFKFDAVGAIAANQLTSRGYRIERDVQQGEHPSHVHLVQPKGLSKSQRKNLWGELAQLTRWVCGPV
jgi:hypothetical protein